MAHNRSLRWPIFSPTLPRPDSPPFSPYLIVEGADRLFAFLEQTFGAEQLDRTLRSDGAVEHGAVRIGDAVVEFTEAREEWPALPAAIHVYVEDTDAAYKRALESGARSLHEPADMPYGERSGAVQDPTGVQWYIATYTGEPKPD